MCFPVREIFRARSDLFEIKIIFIVSIPGNVALAMTSYKVNSYLKLLEKTPEYKDVFSLAHQLHSNQLIFSQLVPSHLAQHCTMGQLMQGKLTIMAENGAIAHKLKQISPSLLLKLQELGWEVTAIQILVQAYQMTQNAQQSLHARPLKMKLSQAGKNSLRQLAASLPNSEFKDTINSFLNKHQTD